MNAFFLMIAFVAIALILFKGARKAIKRSDSKLSINEHPSTFKKPEIEYVSESKQNDDISQPKP